MLSVYLVLITSLSAHADRTWQMKPFVHCTDQLLGMVISVVDLEDMTTEYGTYLPHCLTTNCYISSSNH
jgi:hypothetical protein